MQPRALCHASIMYDCMCSDLALLLAVNIVAAQLAMALGTRVELWHTVWSTVKIVHFLVQTAAGVK